ncbi:response regulator [Cohnella soli]|uniref:Response regulator n=1 Tax=Cohnella soli TaxID=425005 RepID=A0ABW0I180_9BACL
MYKIMLVDDEHIELDTLTRFFPWDELGFEVAGVAKNGREALSQMEETSFDVVITDVRMPIMDGIQFAKAARKRWPRLIIIFMSGYDDFAYVKSALTLEALGYLLKPLDMDELREQMLKVKQKCAEEERNRLSSRVLASHYVRQLLLEEPQPASESRLQELLDELLPAAAGVYSVVLITIDAAYKPADDPSDPGLKTSKIFQRMQQLTNDVQALAVEWQEERLVALVAPGIAQLVVKWHAELLPISPWVTTCLYPQPIALQQTHEVILHMLQVRGRHIAKHGSGHYIAASPAPSGSVDRYDAIIQQVKTLIDHEFGSALTIEYLAEHAYMSPNHFRTLFKEYTGFTVLEHITKVRMERAAELLRDTELKIHEIATHVGYESASHFCSVFHKKRGVTPNQYRNRQPGYNTL